MKTKILDIDKPNANGRVYTRSAVEKAFKKYKENLVDNRRGFIMNSNTDNIEQAYGIVEDIMIEDDVGYIEFKPLTLEGCPELTMLIECNKLHVVTSGIGRITDGIVQDDFIFTHLYLTDDPSYDVD
jgi:hypothetical protein